MNKKGTRITPHIDMGAYDLKWFNGLYGKRDQRLGYDRHLMTQITEAQFFARVGRRENPPPGYAKIIRWENGAMPSDDQSHELQKAVIYIVYGDAAKRMTTKTNIDKSVMYRWDYFGVLSAVMVGELYEAGIYDASLRALHATKDIDFVDKMDIATNGYWVLWNHKGTFTINISEFLPLEEQLGGVYRLAYTQDGRENNQNPHKDKTMLVVDVGGHSTDVGAIDEGMQIDVSSLASVRVGTIEMMRQFDQSLRAKLQREYPETFKGGGEINPTHLEKALISGKYQYGKHKVNVKDIASEVTNLIVNDIVDIVDEFGGALNYAAILLTGGGAALLGKALESAFPDLSIIYAEEQRDMMRYANVMGSARFFKMLERHGVIDDGQ